MRGNLSISKRPPLQALYQGYYNWGNPLVNQYWLWNVATAWSGAEAPARISMPYAGYVNLLQNDPAFNAQTAPSTFRVRVNGVPSTLFITVPAGSTAVQRATGQVSFNVNDQITVEGANGAGVGGMDAQMMIGYVFFT